MTAPLVDYPITIPDVPTVRQGAPFDWTIEMGLYAGGDQDLSVFGTTWASSARFNSPETTLSVDFAVDTTHLTDGYIVLSLTADQTASLNLTDGTGSLYGFDVVATGGSKSPFYVWQGQFAVDGSYTHV